MSTFSGLLGGPEQFIIRVTTRDGRVAYVGANGQTFKSPDAAVRFGPHGAARRVEQYTIRNKRNGGAPVTFEAVPAPVEASGGTES